MAHVRVGVVGHVEWVDFVRVERVPQAGEIVRGSAARSAAAGGGAVAAVQLAHWATECVFFTALGDDERGHRVEADLRARGVTVHAVYRAEPQRRAITLVDRDGERTIIVAGPRHVPEARDALPWHLLAGCAAIYVTGCDVETLRAVRAAPVVVATSRALTLLRDAAIELDAVVGSAQDPAETYRDGDLVPAPHLVVRTDGARGGTFSIAGAPPRHYNAVPAVVRGDTYGAGDTFAAGLTYALGVRREPADAIAFAAARAAEVLAFEGPYPPS
jgi:ribokinase